MENFIFLSEYLCFLKKDLFKAFIWNVLYLVYLKGIVYGLVSMNSIEVKKYFQKKEGKKVENGINVNISWRSLKNGAKNTCAFIWNVILFTLHLDYQTSDIVKEELSQNNFFNKKDKRGILINYFNTSNLIMAAFFYVFVILYGYNETSILILLFFILRSLYRSFEIIHAFVKDTTKPEKNKKSNLKKHDRLSLVIKSYIEVIILNAVVYKILFKLYGGLEPIIYSLGITTFGNFSFERSNILLENAINIVELGKNFNLISTISQLRIHQYYLGNLVMIFQVIATLALVLLSLSIYTGYKEN